MNHIHLVQSFTDSRNGTCWNSFKECVCCALLITLVSQFLSLLLTPLQAANDLGDTSYIFRESGTGKLLEIIGMRHSASSMQSNTAHVGEGEVGNLEGKNKE